MAMRELIEGDCGITNPLLKVASHYTQEKGPQVGQPSSASASNELVKEFLLENNEAERLAPQTFNMESLLNEMSEIDEMYHRPPHPTENYINRENEWVQNIQQSYNLAYENNRLNALESLDNTWADEFLITSEQDIQNQRGLGNDWAQNFKAQSCSEITEIATGLSESVTDPKISESKFMRFIKKVGEGEVDLTQLEEQDTKKNIADIWSSDFAATWTDPVENLETAWDTAAQSTSDFKASTQTEDEKEEEAKNDADFWDTLQKEWEKMAKDDGGAEHPWLSDFESFDNYREYSFTNENPFIDHEEPFEEGLKKLESGDLPSAVLLFEAAVQKNSNHLEAWQYLGSSQAKNEQDPAAIAAFKRCLELDPKDLNSLMLLAISYTNESMQAQACDTLIRWLHTNPKYTHFVDPSLVEEDTSTVSSILSNEKHKAALNMFIEAARMSPKDPDPDVQNGLGVLFNLSGDYDKAIDCFKAALQVQPNDSLLWNRVGATLANNNQSGEAIEAYHRALELYPGFIRSRFNLGISCINLGAVTEAAEHFLSALNLQNAGRGPQGVRSKSAMSSNIWSTLRTVMTLLQRPDLYEAIDRRDLDLLNKEFGMEA